MLGLRRCLLTLKEQVKPFGQRTLKQVKQLPSLKGTAKKVSPYLNGALSQLRSLITRIWQKRGTMKRCFSLFLSISASSFSKVTGILMKVQLFQSLIARYTLWSTSRSLTLGQSLGLAITVMVVTLVFSGLL